MRRLSNITRIALSVGTVAAGVVGISFAIAPPPPGGGVVVQSSGGVQATVPFNDAGLVFTSNGPDAAPSFQPGGSVAPGGTGGVGVVGGSFDVVSCDAGTALGSNDAGALICDVNLTAQTLSFASGYVASLGLAVDTFSSDANYTSPATVYNNLAIQVGGTQTSRNYVLPLTSGAIWLILNETTSRFQAIGSSGTGSWIPSDSAAWCHSNGTNILCQTIGQSSKANDIGTIGPQAVIDKKNQDESCYASGSNYPVCWSIVGGGLDGGLGPSDAGYGPITNNTSWYLVHNYCPTTLTTGTTIWLTIRIYADDNSVLADGGGLFMDAGGNTAGGGGYGTTGNAVSILTKFFAKILNNYPDGGPGPFVSICDSSGTPCNVNQGTAASLSNLSITDQHGCTQVNGTSGCVNNGSTSFAMQAVFDGGCLQVSVNAGSNTVTYPWTLRAEGKEERSTYP